MNYFRSPEKEPPLSISKKCKYFLAVHWKGLVTLLTPIIFLFVILPPPVAPYQWVGYTVVVMAVYWVSECIPLAVTSFIPIVMYPMTGVMSSSGVCQVYFNDTILMFIGSLFLAYSIEQSGLHKRLAFFTIRVIGYSHFKLLLALCCVTTFVSMWITNTAATTMMIPINFAILRVFESQGVLKVFDTNPNGEPVASDITTCYFCAATFSATIGGIGTLVGTGTNIAFKGLFERTYPTAPELLSFPLFSAFGVPYMILLEICCYLYLAIVYLGLFMPNSKIAKKAVITPEGIKAAKRAIEVETAKLGRFTFMEGMVAVLFFAAMAGFFCRSPQIFYGWGDAIRESFQLPNKFDIRDSSVAMLVTLIMFIFPRSLAFFKNWTASSMQDLPKGKIKGVLDWMQLNKTMPWSFLFLLGAGFALASGAKESGLNDKIGEQLMPLRTLSNGTVILIISIIVIFITNFASNVAVANVMVPLAMEMGERIKVNPLWYCVVVGFCASFCFMLPVGTPGNLIVQSAANIPTSKMIKAGFGVSVTTVIVTTILGTFYAPAVWPSLGTYPEWAKKG